MLPQNSRIAIIGAMDEEVSALYKHMQSVETIKIGPVEFYVGELNQKAIILFKSGIGITMAAMSTTLCLSHFNVEAIINIGTAGGLSDHLNVLDVVVSDQVTYHDLDLSVFGVSRSFDLSNRYIFHSDPELLKLFKTIKIDSSVHVGPLVSGHQFIHQHAQIETIQTHFPQAIAVEMEGAAIAHVCHEFKKPFIIIRSISDNVHAPKNEMSFDQYLLQASERSAQFCYDLVGLM